MDRYRHVEAYIEYLARQHGLSIAVKDFAGFTAKNPDVALKLSGHCIHHSPYCLFLKSHAKLWDRCQAQSRALHGRCRTGDVFSGLCYAGYAELVLPVLYDGRVIAAVCAGGFELDPDQSLKRREQLRDGYGLDPAVLEARYRASMSAGCPDLNTIGMACGMLADFCQMYYAALAAEGVIDPNAPLVDDSTRLDVLTCVAEYVHLHFEQDIRLRDIAAFCGCSESYISHLFNKHMHVNLNQFINQVRVARARRMLAEGAASVRQVASAVGFSDPNYFSTVFGRLTGCTPTEYARSLRTAGEMNK